MIALSLGEIVYVIEKVHEKLESNKRYLNQLDTIVGDGDHGFNMANSFKIAKDNLANRNFKDWSDIFKILGTSLLTSGDGTTNLLYGKALIRAAELGVNRESFNIYDFKNVLSEIIDEIRIRGEAEIGDKTMLDSLIPSYEEIQYGLDNKLDTVNIMKNSINAAKNGAQLTRLIEARRGRAVALGERSIGYQDAGATSTLIILEAIGQATESILFLEEII